MLDFEVVDFVGSVEWESLDLQEPQNTIPKQTIMIGTFHRFDMVLGENEGFWGMNQVTNLDRFWILAVAGDFFIDFDLPGRYIRLLSSSGQSFYLIHENAGETLPQIRIAQKAVGTKS